jgi:hypothetical protein
MHMAMRVTESEVFARTESYNPMLINVSDVIFTKRERVLILACCVQIDASNVFKNIADH